MWDFVNYVSLSQLHPWYQVGGIHLANAELPNAELLNVELLNAELSNDELSNVELPIVEELRQTSPSLFHSNSE
jgi:hypothetical protein